jgi:hypothetical protein
VVEIKHYFLRLNIRHVCHKSPSLAVVHSERYPWLQGHIWGKNIAGDCLKCIRVPFAVTLGRRHCYVFLVADRHPIERLLETRDNLALTLHKLQRPSAGRGIYDLSIVETKRIIEADYLAIYNCRSHLCHPISLLYFAHVGRGGPFSTLLNRELNALTFLQAAEPFLDDGRVMHKHIPS